MQDILFGIAEIPEIAPDLSPMVELTWKQSGEQYMLQLVNNSGIFSNSYFAPIRMTELKILLPRMAGRTARTLNGGHVITVDEGDTLSVTLNELNEYEAIVLQ